MGRSVCFIRIFAYKMHPNGFCCFYGRYIGVFAVGIQDWIIRISERPVTDCFGGLSGIAFPLAVTADMVADFRQYLSMDILERQPAVADQLTGFLQAHGPQPEAVLPIAVHVPFDSSPDSFLIKGIRIMPHHIRISQDCI